MITNLFSDERLARYITENDLPWPVIVWRAGSYIRLQWDVESAGVRIRAAWVNGESLCDLDVTFLSTIERYWDEREWDTRFLRKDDALQVLRTGVYR